MKFVTDLHLHSKYSRAVSQQMVIPNIAKWAKLKGISVVATADFTHPFWFDHLKNELEEAGNGLCRLKSASDKLQVTSDKLNVKGQMSNVKEVYFLLSSEISSIYSQGGKVRRIHNLFFFPKMASVEKFSNALLKRGANLRSDGRPIVGITSRNLVEIALSCDEKALVIPAHIWTPWFSVFGSFSGFDSLSECFGDMTDHVYGVETGLSSDPAMNWRIGDLKQKTILSFSDAHSLEKIGREATIFEADEISYDSIYNAVKRVGESKSKSGSDSMTLKNFDSSRIAFTIEFYPEEGKYHFTGHNNCNFSQGSDESKKNGIICPVCHKPLTVGVMDRVEDLASGISNFKFQISNGIKWIHSSNSLRPPYVSLVPLSEVISDAVGSGVGTKKVSDFYFSLVNNLGGEFAVLLKADISDISKFSSERVSEAIKKVRERDIHIEPGFDGRFGVVKIWSDNEKSVNIEVPDDKTQLDLFS